MPIYHTRVFAVLWEVMRGPEQMIFGDINGRIQRFEGLHGPRKHPRKVLKQYWHLSKNTAGG
jgi:hypothetical protein